MKKPLVIHPLLFAISPILALYSHNLGRVTPHETLIPTAVILGFTILFLLILTLILRNFLKAGIIVSAFLVLNFSFGYVYDEIQGWQILGFLIGSREFLTSFCFVVFISIVFLIVLSKKKFYNFSHVLNITGTALVIIPLFNIGVYSLKSRQPVEQVKDTRELQSPTKSKFSIEAISHPDIYYIILDRYASSSTLKEVFNFDNSEFINYLSNKGFYVASESLANYLKTAHSLASSLNLDYINYLSIGNDESDDWRPLHRMVKDNKVWRFLKNRGYKFIHFGSWWGPTNANENADINITVFTPEFSEILIDTTMLYHNLSKISRIYEGKRLRQWKTTNYEFQKLAEIPKMKEPTFVFAHMLITHEPYVFDRDGNFLTDEESKKISSEDQYVNQVIFANKKVKEFIEKVLLDSESPPIIILQADEGPLPLRYRLNEDNFNWTEATKEELREKMRILNAYYLPNVHNNTLYPSITPVNTFRLIFNLYFNTSFEALPDQAYAFTDQKHIYKFFNVTNKVNYQ